MNSFNERYQRQITLPQLGENGQLSLENSSVLVVGAGGLGCPALQYLAAAGVGNIHIVDFDTISAGNLNRQTLFNADEIGQNKSLVAAQKLRAFNAEIQVFSHPLAFSNENATQLVHNCDLVLDCTDNPATRYLINDTCVQLNKPFVYAGIHRMQGQLAVFNFNGGTTYRCVFPEEENKNGKSCEENGVLGTVPGILGTMQAQEAIKIIAMPHAVKNDELLVFNFINNEITRIKTKRINNNRGYSPMPDYINEIDVKQLLLELQSGKTFQFVDVREPHEPPRPDEFEGISLPLSSWNNEYSAQQISNDYTVIVFCQKGFRSEMAIASLPPHKRQNIYNLRGGLSAWYQLKLIMQNERNEK